MTVGKRTARERELERRAIQKNDDIWWARMHYLFHALPRDQSQRWGGDVVEFVEGLDTARSWNDL
jgi:hypothetical protein